MVLLERKKKRQCILGLHLGWPESTALASFYVTELKNDLVVRRYACSFSAFLKTVIPGNTQ
uniref:Protein AFR n=1 Tax=Rhizophora mucronata TaxID=61149 RepID=A0A2P2KRB6_RHIMU